MKVLIYNKYIEKFSFSKATHTFKRLLTKIEQSGGGIRDVEYVPLHGYIRNTPSDSENQLRADKNT